MDIAQSCRHLKSLDGVVHVSSRSSYSSAYSHFSQERSLFSGWFLLNIWKWKAYQVSCSCTVEKGLRPRPKRKPVEQAHTVERKTSREDIKINVPSSICVQIENLVLCRRYAEALEMFDICLIEGRQEVGRSTYDALVIACIKTKSIRGVKRVFNHMVCSGVELDLYMRNRVLLMHVKCGMMLDAGSLFDEMSETNLVSWNTIIVGLLDSGEYKEAFRLFLFMWEEFSEAGSRTLAMMLRACAGLENIFAGKQLHSCVLKMDLGGNAFISCALIDMYSKCGSIEDAQCIFDDMPEKTTVAWNSIIAGYSLNGFSQEVLDLYDEMRDSGVEIDKFTFSSIIRVCVRLASLEHAKQAHAGLVRHGFQLDVVANTALVDLYSKWGRIEDAKKLFEKMSKKTVITWNALIAGYGIHGLGTAAVELFEQMVHEGVKPNHVTFLAVIGACSYSGLSDHGWKIYDSMRNKVKPRAMHYACMVELLGREGLLDEAFALIEDAPFRPTVNMWSALLTACRFHKNFELGKFAIEKIYLMEPLKLSNYHILLNIYNGCGKQLEAAAVTGTVTKQGLRLLPSSTWINVKKQQHTLVFGDKCNAQTKAIYECLNKLMMEISNHGYVPNNKPFLPDVDEQEQQMPLYHSEKLAVSFGIINTSYSIPLCLGQSHRICEDCHDVIKCIAMATQREIVVRDASRFHRFKQGKCSCGDYW